MPGYASATASHAPIRQRGEPIDPHLGRRAGPRDCSSSRRSGMRGCQSPGAGRCITAPGKVSGSRRFHVIIRGTAWRGGAVATATADAPKETLPVRSGNGEVGWEAVIRSPRPLAGRGVLTAVLRRSGHRSASHEPWTFILVGRYIHERSRHPNEQVVSKLIWVQPASIGKSSNPCNRRFPERRNFKGFIFLYSQVCRTDKRTKSCSTEDCVKVPSAIRLNFAWCTACSALLLFHGTPS
jgi:hypothetical protein